jgi:hypothetical protein
VKLQWTSSGSTASLGITPLKKWLVFDHALVGFQAISESEETFFIKLLVKSVYLQLPLRFAQ